MNRRRRLPGVVIVAGAVCLWALCVRSAAQQILRSGVNLVVVDVRILSKNKQVTDLRRDEITLLVDGRPRPIVSFEYNPVASSTRRPSRQGPDPTPAATRSSNRLVILVDRDSLPPSDRQPVRENVQRFLKRVPRDVPVAVATLPLSQSARFERDPERIRQAVDAAFTGAFQRTLGMEAVTGFGCDSPGAPKNCGGDVPISGAGAERLKAMQTAAEVERQQTDVLRDLRWLFVMLSRTGEATDVVLVNGGLPYLARMQPEVDRVTGVARVGRVRVHTLQIPRRGGLKTDEPVSPEIDRAYPEAALVPSPLPAPATYDLAATTGGLAEDGSSSGKEFFDRLEQELAGSYLLSFEPLPAERDGKLHRIEIRIPGRSKLTIHARQAFVFMPDSVKAQKIQDAQGVTGSEGSKGSEGSGTSPGSPGVPVSPLPVTSSLRTVVERASDYIDRFERSFSTVVAEERYVQVLKSWTGAPPSRGDEPALEWAASGVQSGHRDDSILRRRQLLSDLLLVQTPAQMWIGYRDVAEVDGKAVRDRAVRVQQLFLSKRSEDQKQLRRIAAESARQNLGMYRNVNTPTFPLLVLRRSNVERFSLAQYPDDHQDDTCCAVVGFREVARPTLVKTATGRDIPMAGQFWIEERTGRVRRATLEFTQTADQVRGVFDVGFRADPALDVLVPDWIWEWYMSPNPDVAGRQAYVEGQATYPTIRRFTVTTDEQLK